MPLNEGRGINPGDTRTQLVRREHSISLNEGRGINPGDTAGVRFGAAGRRSRSTKAGASTPATPTFDIRLRGDQLFHGTLNEGRGINPGDTRVDRWRISHALACPLNEGRGINPGDTTRRISVGAFPIAHCAQRRPGHQPRRHHGSHIAARRWSC